MAHSLLAPRIRGLSHTLSESATEGCSRCTFEARPACASTARANVGGKGKRRRRHSAKTWGSLGDGLSPSSSCRWLDPSRRQLRSDQASCSA